MVLIWGRRWRFGAASGASVESSAGWTGDTKIFGRNSTQTASSCEEHAGKGKQGVRRLAGKT
jgi:hypothetical protein